MTKPADNSAPGPGMKFKDRVRLVVCAPAFAVLVFVISLVLFHWPYLAEEGRWTASHLFITMFAGWALVIGLVVLLSLFLPSSSSENKKTPPNG